MNIAKAITLVLATIVAKTIYDKLTRNERSIEQIFDYFELARLDHQEETAIEDLLSDMEWGVMHN